MVFKKYKLCARSNERSERYEWHARIELIKSTYPSGIPTSVTISHTHSALRLPVLRSARVSDTVDDLPLIAAVKTA